MPNNPADYMTPDERRRLAHVHSLHEIAEHLIRRYAANDPVALRHAAALRACINFLWPLPSPRLEEFRQAAADRLRKGRQRAKAAEPGGEVQP